MPKHKPIDPNEDQVPADTEALNQRILNAVAEAPDVWSLDLDMVRQARREGKGIFPLEPFDLNAEDFTVSGPASPITVRAIRPEGREETGTFMHIHGGGWVFGNADMQDQRLKELANGTGLACLSVEYRLSPEHPYPAAPDDCEAVALWLAEIGGERFNTSFLAIGGESAGGHLAANTLIRLRDKHQKTPFHAAVLIAGIFDLGMTPSAANFKSDLILRHKDMVNFANCYLQNNEDRRHPDISPLYAPAHDMPPTHFSIGTADPLMDDSLFIASCWAQCQADIELDIYPGACHVFQYFDALQQAKESRANIIDFLNRVRESRS
ncbi:MAG: alpha/beta hydrolase [Pseudomonadota bacterium]